jgi:23S rRNA pseudouridine2605 synthase
VTPISKPPRRSREVSLERALSKLGIASRSETRQWILAGRLAVDGIVRDEPQHPVVPEEVRLTLDGRPLIGEPSRTIMVHKPRGLVTTRSDERKRPTVYDILPEAWRHLKAVGRLDMASSGLLLFTGDTRLAAWITDPENAVPRVYRVTVRGRITNDELARLAGGVEDAGECLRPHQVTLRKASGRESHLIVTLSEGKNREVRRLFAAVGHEVTALKRVGLGGLVMGNLPPGQCREVTPTALEPEELPCRLSRRPVFLRPPQKD